ncbi:MAG TPA: hypothetical protein VH277_15930 [Gemmatimonadaceae bacterium]|jgi:hypothetical protein|nr:hypothetical protein [Gemmatimonadaceae bacterium]
MASIAGAGLMGVTAAARPIARLDPGVSFNISSTSRVYPGDTPRGQDDEVMRGRGVAVNGRARIEFLAYTPAPQGVTTDDFVITGDSGHVFVLHAADQRVTPSDDVFGGPAVVTLNRVMGGGGRGFPGGAGGAAGDANGGGGGGGGRGGGGGGGGGRPNRGGGGGPPGGFPGRGGRGGRGRGGLGGFLNQVELLDVKFGIEKLGAGDAIEGHATQHYRVTTDYRILWGDQSIPAHAVTEIWSTVLPTAIPNPFEPLVVADQSTDGPLIEYALKLRNIRAQIEGTPIKVVTTTTLSDIHDVVGFQAYVGNDPTVNKLTVVQQTEIRNIKPADVDPKLVAVSAGE